MWSAAILAGGRARRFGGRDKGALVVEGQSILARQLSVLHGLTSDVLIVMAQANDRRVEGARVVVDRRRGAGPLGGLQAALLEAHNPTVFLVACDMPYITRAFAQFLLDQTRDADIVMPKTADGYHPLCAAYTRACLPAIGRRLASRHLALVGLLADARARIVTTEEIRAFGPEARLLLNLNTPTDYAAIETVQADEP